MRGSAKPEKPDFDCYRLNLTTEYNIDHGLRAETYPSFMERGIASNTQGPNHQS